MSKTNTPFLSLASQGTIAKTLTTQKGADRTIVRTKPIPLYRQTLPQLYQRWLYQDYSHLWTQQSVDTKRQYAADGVRFHLTGFQYWMKYQLTNLPDILAWWKADHNLGATTPDSSRSSNPLSILGPSPATGRINGCLSYDGINDTCRSAKALSLSNAEITIEAFAYLISSGAPTHPAIFASESLAGGYINLNYNGRPTFLFRWNDGPNTNQVSINALTEYDGLHHFCGVLSPSSSYARLYIDGIERGSRLAGTFTYNSLNLITLGKGQFIHYWPGLIDNVIVYNRILDLATIQRHSLRRYPL